MTKSKIIKFAFSTAGVPEAGNDHTVASNLFDGVLEDLFSEKLWAFMLKSSTNFQQTQGGSDLKYPCKYLITEPGVINVFDINYNNRIVRGLARSLDVRQGLTIGIARNQPGVSTEGFYQSNRSFFLEGNILHSSEAVTDLIVSVRKDISELPPVAQNYVKYAFTEQLFNAIIIDRPTPPRISINRNKFYNQMYEHYYKKDFGYPDVESEAIRNWLLTETARSNYHW